MKTPLISSTILLALTSSISLANAGEQDQSFYLQVAQQIAANLQSAEAHFTSSDNADLTYLNATSDTKAVKEQDKSPNSPILEDHSNAEKRLAARFAGEFKQTDDVVDPNYKSGTPFLGARDVYTFCPQGAEVQRPITDTTSIVSGQLEYAWGWSRCSSGDAIRVQDIWVSNVKQGHPILTLLMVEDGQPGEKTNMDIDLNQLATGKISASDISKSIRPTN